MKIRIKGNSLRYRLTRSEVLRFVTDGYLEEKINFGGAVLSYTLCRTDGEQLSASFRDNRITVYIPGVLTGDWVDGNQVGFENHIGLGDSGETLYLLVEKDYTCLENVEEDQSDNYPNPLKKGRDH
ncbi:MAG: hypothetical protein P4L51_02275 [Puia sp.]|nr:hypothetical protein [Puia sp.]